MVPLIQVTSEVVDGLFMVCVCVSVVSPCVFVGVNATQFPLFFPSVLVKRIPSGGHLGSDALRAPGSWVGGRGHQPPPPTGGAQPLPWGGSIPPPGAIR